ncbi:DciA family protein [Roseococcus sp. DSY-14]|uniref:DciA family protein n=1 Tax=Roseococcus sp. DSY-14 TaxID=3369650 RepID=UPI00387B2BAE
MAGDSTEGTPKSRGVFSRDLKPLKGGLGAPVRPARAKVPLAPPIPERLWRTVELGSLVPRLTRPAFRRKSPESAQLLADWPALAGPALAAMAEPVRLSGGTLTLACTGPAAMELGLMAPVIVERLNAALGRPAVRKLAFVQRAPRLPGPARPRRPPPPEAPAEGLEAALERLARARRP